VSPIRRRRIGLRHFRSRAVTPEGGWSGLVDLHSHVLPGVDDGACSFEESVEIVRAAERDGISAIAATPHVRDDFPTRSETMLLLVEDMRDRLRTEGVHVDLLPGGEVAFDMIAELDSRELRAFCLAGNPRYLLVEAPYLGWPLGIAETFFTLRLEGMAPVLAHPERNPLVQEDPERLRPLVDGGALVQLTASSLDGRAGKHVTNTARRLLALQLAHLVASDAHRPAVRRAGMAAALEAVGDLDLACWLGRDLPAAIAYDRPLPDRPAPASRRRRTPPHHSKN
jgi:protein-tyrosine phosphatase